MNKVLIGSILFISLTLSAIGSATTDLRQILFKVGAPIANQSLSESLADKAYALSTLDFSAQVLKKYPTVVVEVSGHTDSHECAPKECLALSVRRAELAAAYLLEKGVPPSQIDRITGYGSTRPLSLRTKDGSERALNRRIEVTSVRPRPGT